MSYRKTILRLALGLEDDPARMAEVERYLTALLEACNRTHDDKGEQDALAMAEAVAILLAIQHGGMDDAHVRGVLNYITQRALIHIPEARASGKCSRHVVVPD